MNQWLRERLVAWADEYETTDFIKSDPVQFPHRYSRQEDIEIMGLLTALLSFGNRTQILKKADSLDETMGHRPLEYVVSEKWTRDFPADDRSSYYRMVSKSQFRQWIEKLYEIYVEGRTLEDEMMRREGLPMERLCGFMGVGSTGPQKKLNMFLRWMIRRQSAVDFGLWTKLDPSQLIIPLDTHVCRVAHQLGLTKKNTFSLGNAKTITNAMAEVFPGDPCRGDFALFGYGANGRTKN